ncbi:MAG: hypothetical protein J6J36_00865 [Clostridia bacterium]|nr:hypothetical protein [Clostridia bacterium]
MQTNKYLFHILGKKEMVYYDDEIKKFKSQDLENDNIESLVADITNKQKEFLKINIINKDGLTITPLNFCDTPANLQLIGGEQEINSLIANDICYVNLLKMTQENKTEQLFSSLEFPESFVINIQNNNIVDTYNALDRLLSMSSAQQEFIYKLSYKFHGMIRDEVEWKAIENIIRELTKKYNNTIIITDYPTKE